jgi:hypothetical protein
MIATERNEMALSGFLNSFQTPRHKGSLRPETTPLKPKPGLSGPPARTNQNSRLKLVLHEENWLPLIRPLDTFTAVRNAVGG